MPQLPKQYQGIKKPDLLFDLVCYHNFVAGQFDGKIPVQESRQVYEEIKRLLSLPPKPNKTKKI